MSCTFVIDVSAIYFSDMDFVVLNPITAYPLAILGIVVTHFPGRIDEDQGFVSHVNVQVPTLRVATISIVPKIIGTCEPTVIKVVVSRLGEIEIYLIITFIAGYERAIRSCFALR